MPRNHTRLKPKPKKSMAPLWLALAGLGLVLIAGFAILSNNNRPKTAIEVRGAPSLKVEQDTIDHGDVKLGNTVVDIVQVTNVGDQPLRFAEAPYIEVREGC